MPYATKYTPETREQFAIRIAGGESILAAASALGINRTTAQRWKTEGRNSGLLARQYEKTPKGFLMRAYRNMKSRVDGVQKLKAHLYVGKGLHVSKEDFYAWSEADTAFNRLFSAWVRAGYDQRLTPSIDRIDSNKGYSLSNMRWITHSMNSALAHNASVESRKLKQALYRAAGINHVKA